MMHDMTIDRAEATPFHLLAESGEAEPLLAARGILAARRAMNGPFEPVFIPNPVLEIMLTLFVAEAEGRAQTDADLRGVTTVATATAGRWVKALIEDGMIAADGEARRLTAKGRDATIAAMRSVIAALRKGLLIA